MKRFPIVGTIFIVLGLLAMTSASAQGGKIGDVIYSAAFLIIGVLSIYARLILNRMDDARANPQSAQPPHSAS